MNRLSQQCIVAVIAILGFIVLVGTVGSYEYADEIVYSMPDAVYESIQKELGEDASNKAVAAEYMNKRHYYDNLQY